jgi:hypothetical protein
MNPHAGDSMTPRPADPTPAPPPGLTHTGVPPAASDLPLPHDRDESPGATAVLPDPVIEQARRDLDAGMVDTDMRATPGLDAARRARLVPTPRGPR